MTCVKDYKLLWNEAMQQLKTQFGAQPMDWWTPLKYADSSENEIIVSAPSAYHKDQVKTRFMVPIEATISELAGKPIKITIKEKQTQKSAKSMPEPDHSETKDEEPHSPAYSEAGIRKLPETSNTPNTAKKYKHLQLKNEFTFGTFIVSDKNKYTFAAAQAVARNLGTSYNPLLIYGGVGLGKTHLMQAIGNYVHSHLESRIIYVTAENFMNEFIESINDRKTASAFRNKYRHADLLMLDDIHSLKNAESTLSELFNTYEALYNANKQMIFTCDRPVSELKNLTERLRSRFGSGLNVEIQLPDYETRFAIVKSKIKTHEIVIPDDVISFVCKNITTNVRDLVSSLTKLFSYAELMSRPVTLEIAQQQLKETISSTKQSNISAEIIIRVVAEYFSLTPTDLRSKKKSRNIVHPRHLAMFIIRDLTELSTTDIGQLFGGRDHTTVINAIDKTEKRILTDPAEERTIQTLKGLTKENHVK
jgi:chromosomal replication initiator protein